MLAVHCVPKNCPLAGVGIDVMQIDRSGADAQGLEEVLIDQVGGLSKVVAVPHRQTLAASIRARHIQTYR